MRGTGVALTLTGLALLLPTLPDLLQRRVPELQASSTLASLHQQMPPAPSLRPRRLLEDGLLERLEQADQAWIPRAESLGDGGTRYIYQRRAGDPELSLPQIRALIARPPSFAHERRSIVALLTTLEQVGASVGLIEPIKAGAAAEWDPQARTLRLRPDLPDQGSLQLARALNHEAIHVAQSCVAGGVAANPRPLGLVPDRPVAGASRAADRHHGSSRTAPVAPLQDPVYADAGPLELRMEQEAYSLQDQLDLGIRLLRMHCLGRKAG